MLNTGAIEAAAFADPSPEGVAEALKLAPEAEGVADLHALLAMDLDGIVIATPSALHSEQSIAALHAGCAVFCQKPLGRTAEEAKAVVDAARAADRLLSVDFSYRFTEGVRRIRELIDAGELGRVFAVDLTFHNAYGPDKPWFFDRAQSGGGCVMDLGVHLVDLALLMLRWPELEAVTSNLFSGGERLSPGDPRVEDYAGATLTLAGGAVVRLVCSWNVSAGQDAVIEAQVFGTQGGARITNKGGDFFDFTAERFRGTGRELLSAPPDPWGGRAAADWAARLAGGERFDPQVERLVDVARVIDRIYGAA